MADGSEYKGHYGVSADTLRDFHRRRAELLWQAGADVLLFETEPSLMEAEVEAQIAEELGAPYWISFSCCDGRHNCEGQLLADCARQLARNYPHLQAIGVNCTKPEYIASLIGELKGASDLPIIVYPNSGEEYDPQTKTWHGVGTDRRFGDYALDYMKAGAVAVGGCCTTVFVVCRKRRCRMKTAPFLHFLEPRVHDEPGQGQDDEGAGDGADHRADAFFGDD